MGVVCGLVFLGLVIVNPTIKDGREMHGHPFRQSPELVLSAGIAVGGLMLAAAAARNWYLAARNDSGGADSEGNRREA